MFASDIKHTSPALQDKLHQLYTLNRNKAIDLSFRPPYLDLLDAFGNPHLNLPPVIHVAGTNGKGSVIAILKSILEAGGYKVHAYTSPHLQHFNERLYLAGAPIDDDALEDLIDEAIMLNNGDDVTFFEITTAMALAAFSRTPADICLLEVGLGGRLDCTNVIEAPVVSIINTIGYDHTEFLGETLPEIASEKAGIMKDHCPCVIGVQRNDENHSAIQKTFDFKAQETQTSLLRYGADWLIEPYERDQAHHIRFVFQGQEMLLPMPGLEGIHQIENTGSALAALKVIEDQFPLSHSAYEIGLRAANWPARLQALPYKLPEGWELYLDGGHNQSAGQALAQSVSQWTKTDPKDLHLILGMMDHKAPKDLLEPLLPSISSITVIDIPDEPKALTARALKGLIEGEFRSLKVQEAKSFEDGIKRISHENKAQGRILIAGSLYLAGHVLHKINKPS